MIVIGLVLFMLPMLTMQKWYFERLLYHVPNIGNVFWNYQLMSGIFFHFPTAVCYLQFILPICK